MHEGVSDRGTPGLGRPAVPSPQQGRHRSPVSHLLPLQGDRFHAHSKLGNRRLLWHGTNVAVVAAILTSGLRIMPHSGGRVGKGIYFASENSKSIGYGEGPSGQALGRHGDWGGRGPVFTQLVGAPGEDSVNGY